jgi:hypothetical protein
VHFIAAGDAVRLLTLAIKRAADGLDFGEIPGAVPGGLNRDGSSGDIIRLLCTWNANRHHSSDTEKAAHIPRGLSLAEGRATRFHDFPGGETSGNRPGG